MKSCGNTFVPKVKLMSEIYCSEELIDDTYCDSCGDSDTFIGIASSKPKAREIIRESMFGDLYLKWYIEKFLKENF